ncbi:hypothetical protein GGS23DRAFT_600884 [Durotheca rogersii]|uniref:uncharacterized protein n=1 Tax=Durotheca rogersii TaxID=419775 RepID=UPI00221EA04E|nr:uncharacterized protein GGS23DRAFT_600884 [Durotheca rogersii]KAI5857396.1 hypothetical protein GGS23DRAFT_600884 [Durotheca rogersii]
MSGRSAYVRKKITEPKSGVKSSGNPRVHEHDDLSSISDAGPPGTGYGTTTARFLRFSESIREDEIARYRTQATTLSDQSSEGHSAGSEAGRREGGGNPQHRGPMPDFAYARARKPVLRTEDVSGIERSGFRSAVDKKSDEFRKGLTKAFTFGAKKKKAADTPFRPGSSTTSRNQNDGDFFDTSEAPVIPLQSPQHRVWDPEYQQMISPPPAMKLPPIPPPSSAPPFKRWVGAGKPAQRWNKLRKDPELWDLNGDVLVFFGRKGQLPRPNPSLRVSSRIIEATESRFLITLLREGATDDEYAPQVPVPLSPIGAPPTLLRPHGSYSQAGYRNGQPTPPISEDASLTDTDGQISYEMYFPTPPNLSKLEAHRHAITTRNVFALLYHASLVGLSLFQALSDLLARLTAYMPPETDNVGNIIKYLTVRGIDDARNDPEIAVSLLAWSESSEVRWEGGWCEAFAHCGGMYSRLEICADFKNVTPITRALLERTCLEVQLRVQAAEGRLAEFSFEDIWPTTGPAAHGAARNAADRLQQFLVGHFAKKYGDWPPPDSGARTADGEEMWLTRTMARQMEKDFGSLYDYLVNRDIVWDESETRSSRKWMMVSENGDKSFDPDTPDLPLTDMLIEFDNRMRFPHIPHPYPLVPESIPPIMSPPSSSARERSKKDKSNVNNTKQGGDDRIVERRAQLAYTEATNIYILGSDFLQTDLIEGFVKFEKADHIGTVDPFVARRGRWVLIYGILQTIASVAVDSPDIHYRENVSYHLSPRFKGAKAPPWKGASRPAAEAGHELSHCWAAPRTWHSGSDGADSDTSANSVVGGSDPVLRMMMRAKARQFPRPPQTVASRSSSGGWGSTSRSGRPSTSAGTPGPATPTMATTWGGSSTMSVGAASDNTNYSSWPMSATEVAAGHQASQGRGSGSSGNNKAERAGRATATLGSAASPRRIEDPKWLPPPLSIHRMNPPAPLDLHLETTRTGEFLDVTFSPNSPSGSGGGIGPALSPGSSDGPGPVIRDFDELECVDEEYS